MHDLTENYPGTSDDRFRIHVYYTPHPQKTGLSGNGMHCYQLRLLHTEGIITLNENDFFSLLFAATH